MDGIKKGLQHIADFLQLFVRAVEAGNAEASRDGVSLIKQWLRETTDTAGKVRINQLSLLFGADPWRDSRKMYREYALRWNGKI